jgi:hypothetical protein
MAVVEITVFRLAEGVADDEFLSLDAAAQTEFAHLQPGIIRRTTARGDDGRWVVVTLWGSAEAADAAAAAAPSHPAGAAFLAAIDPPAWAGDRFTTID